MKEVWKDIIGYEGLYQVSSLGRVKSTGTVWNGWVYHKKKETIRKSNANVKNGYHSLCLSKDSKVKRHYVHRLVGESFIDNPLNKPQINHLDGNKNNNKVDNLEWVTRKENVQHAIKNGLSHLPIPQNK